MYGAADKFKRLIEPKVNCKLGVIYILKRLYKLILERL